MSEVARDLEDRLRPLAIASNEAWWEAATRVDEETERRQVAADLALTDLYADGDAFDAIRDARTGKTDALNARVLTVLCDAFTPYQIADDLRRRLVEKQSAIQAVFSSHRPTLDGQAVDDNAIAEVLTASDDVAARRAAWEASKEVGAVVADRVRDLARLRNTAARSVGYRDHFELTLATSELDEARLLATLDDVERATAGPFASWKRVLDERLADRFECAVDDLRPWHYADPFFQQAPAAIGVRLDEQYASLDLEALTLATYERFGLDVGPILQRSDLLPRDAKNQHAFCIDIDRAGDIRVLCNNEHNERWTETMLHEFGHAVYFDGVERSLPWTLRTMHSLTTEAVAMLAGRLVHDPDWLREIVGLAPADVDALAPRLAAARTGALLAFVRWALVMTHFERRLYADPGADHDTAWWELVERFQGVRRPPGRRAPDWAAKIHVAVAPVYYQNYLYGELLASQLQATLTRETGGLLNRDAGRILSTRVFAPGAALRWDHLVEQATGSPLSPRAFVEQLGG